MDAVTYIKAYVRMCDSFDSKNNITGKPCVGCPLDDIGRGCHMNDLTNNAEECVAAVEKWAKEHPVRTRQSEFLRQWPDARLYEGVLEVCPAKLSSLFRDENGRCSKTVSFCPDCRRDFWLAEIKDEEA